MFTLKQELKTQSPMDSPHRPSERGSAKKAKKSPSKLMRLSDGRSVEIVNDSSNDAFTYLCTHPEPPPQPQSNTTPSLQTAVKAEEATTEAKTEKDEKSRKSRKRGRAPSVRQEAEDPSGFDRGRCEAR